jgi:hypothetical protein
VNLKRETRNSKLETRNAKRETRNAKRETRNAKLEQNMIPSIGRIVHYTLTAEDAECVNRRRTSPEQNRPRGTHVGNPAHAGQIVPLIITTVWVDEYGPGNYGVNGQVLLDGNDSLWITSASQGDGEGQWHEPPRIQ